MGRHAEAAATQLDVARIAEISGLAGGTAWVLAYLLPGAALADGLAWLGSVLVTAAWCGLGLLLVRSNVLALRLFVAVALPTLVWGVLVLVHGSAARPTGADAVLGVVVALVSGLLLTRRRPGIPRATL